MSDADDARYRIIRALREREIHAMRAAPLPGVPAIALSLSASAVQRLLDSLVPAPLDRDDGLALRIIGRGSDLGVDDDPWQFEAVIHDTPDALVDLGAGALELHIIVNIPLADVDQVLRRLGA
jgi:hypothetical protein